MYWLKFDAIFFLLNSFFISLSNIYRVHHGFGSDFALLLLSSLADIECNFVFIRRFVKFYWTMASIQKILGAEDWRGHVMHLS